MKKLALALMLLVLPSMALANTSSRLECSSPNGYTRSDRIIETFDWGGKHATWTVAEGVDIHKEWQVMSFYFQPYGVDVTLKHVETGQMKRIVFNNGWVCQNVWLEGEE